MQILVTAATEMEIAPFIKAHPATDILITGVGVPASIYHILKRMNQIDYDLVIQAGICGAFNKKEILGTTILVKRDRFADLGIEEKNVLYTLTEKSLAEEHGEGWLVNDNPMLYDIPIKKVDAITVNKVSDNWIVNMQYAEKFKPHIQSMEGAAIHYVCHNEHIPYLQLRSISNHVGERDKTKWQMELAVHNLNECLAVIISELQKTG